MKKRIFFILTSAINIIASVYAIMDAKNIAQALSNSANMFSGEMGERIATLYQNSGTAFVIFLSIITIVLNFVVIYHAFSDQIIEKKKGIIACNAVTFFLSNYTITEIVTVINIIVILILKEDKKKEEVKEIKEKKKEIPKLEKEPVDKWKVISSIILFATYFSQLIWGRFLPNNPTLVIFIQIAFYVTMVVLSLIVFHDLYKDNFKVFKENFKTYIKFLGPKFGLFYLIYFVLVAAMMMILGDGVSENQNALEALPIFVSAPLAMIYAPIVEEALFRGSIRRFIKNDILFIIISGLSFGLLHTAFSEVSIYNVLIRSLPYVLMGGFMAYLYKRTNNIFCNMSFHFFQNTLAVVIMIFMKGL